MNFESGVLTSRELPDAAVTGLTMSPRLIPVVAYVMHKRVERARHLMLSTAEDLSSIAADRRTPDAIEELSMRGQRARREIAA